MNVIVKVICEVKWFPVYTVDSLMVQNLKLLFVLADHPQLHAQVPASGPHHQEEGAHGLAAQPQVGGVPHLRLHGDRVHGGDGLPEPAGQ